MIFVGFQWRLLAIWIKLFQLQSFLGTELKVRKAIFRYFKNWRTLNDFSITPRWSSWAFQPRCVLCNLFATKIQRPIHNMHIIHESWSELSRWASQPLYQQEISFLSAHNFWQWQSQLVGSLSAFRCRPLLSFWPCGLTNLPDQSKSWRNARSMENTRQILLVRSNIMWLLRPRSWISPSSMP